MVLQSLTSYRPRRTAMNLGLALGITVSALAWAPAWAQQFDRPWEFTPRDRRVAIALAIKQVEDRLLGPSQSFSQVETQICNGPQGTATATSNFFCEIVSGDNNNSGAKGLTSAGNQTATSNTSGPGNVTQGTTSSLTPVISALQRGF